MNSKEKPNPFGNGVGADPPRVEDECRSTDGNCGAKDATEHATKEVFSTVEELSQSENADERNVCEAEECVGSLKNQQFPREDGAMEKATLDELKSQEADRLLEELSQEVDQLLGLSSDTSDTDQFTLSSNKEDSEGSSSSVASRKQQTGSPEQKKAECFVKEMEEEVSKGFGFFKTTEKAKGIESSKDNDGIEEANKENHISFPDVPVARPKLNESRFQFPGETSSSSKGIFSSDDSRRALADPNILEPEEEEVFVKPPNWLDPQILRSLPKLKKSTNPFEPCQPDTFFGKLHQNSPLAYTGHEKEELMDKKEKDSSHSRRNLLQALKNRNSNADKDFEEDLGRDLTKMNLDPQILRSLPKLKKSTNPFEPCQPDTFFGKLHQNSPLAYTGHEKEELMDRKEKDSSHSRRNLLQALENRKSNADKDFEEDLGRDLTKMNVGMDSQEKNESPSFGEEATKEVNMTLVNTLEEKEIEDSLSSLELTYVPACPSVAKPIFAKETDSPLHVKDSDNSHCKDYPLDSKDSPSHSKDSLSHSKDSPFSSNKDCPTSHIRDSISSHIKDSPNSKSKDSIALLSKDSSPAGEGLRDSKALNELSGANAMDKPKATEGENKEQEENKDPEENKDHEENKDPEENKKPEENKDPEETKNLEYILELYDPEFPALVTPLPIKELNAQNLKTIRGMPCAKGNLISKWLYSQSFNDKEYEHKAGEYLPEYSLIVYSDAEEETEQESLVSDPVDNLDALMGSFQSLQLNEAIPECCLTDSVFLVDKPQTAISQGFMMQPLPLKEICQVKDFLKIRVTHVYTPFQFWFNFVNRLYDTSTLNEIQMEMGNFYSDTDNINYLDVLPRCLIKAGYICAIQLDSNWRRVRIVSTPPPDVDTVYIYYVDFGYGEDVPVTYLRYLAINFGEKPELAVRGTLSYIYPLGPHWTPDSMIQFQRLVNNQELFAHVTELDLEERIVFLRISLNEEFLPSVNKLLVEANLAGRSMHYDLKQIEKNFGIRHRYLRERLPSHEMLETGIFPVLNEEFEVAFDAIIYSPAFGKFKVPQMKKGYDALRQALVAWMPGFRQVMKKWAALNNEAKAKLRATQNEARLAWLSRVDKKEKEQKEAKETELQEAKESATEEEKEKTLLTTEGEEEPPKATQEEEEAVMTINDEDETPPVESMETVD
ncbi:enolase-phosphatase E1 isoform X2 [Drosophila kikkawai]|uniref:Enolase-phosphatase E1 isoform X2 n=1 Tax=Drosophila kikkawai TaxID=30033 RepID=A0ABM3C5A2_DROKI|nr:uncharacterized protein LOC108074956 [Drosophila kikkawai]